jgi:NADH:ubiquinone oxidoreductase subunit 6 (subunit J)
MRLLQVEFMALIFVVVYVGAIAVLFLFVVMMLNLNTTSMQTTTLDPRRRDAWATLRLCGARGERLRAGVSGEWVRLDVAQATQGALATGAYVNWVDRLDSRTTLQTMGQVLYTHSFVYLLLAGFVLLVARVGAIVLTLKVRTFARAKRQHVHQQRSRDAERAIMRTRVVRE